MYETVSFTSVIMESCGGLMTQDDLITTKRKGFAR